jgi:hypothetical protein
MDGGHQSLDCKFSAKIMHQIRWTQQLASIQFLRRSSQLEVEWRKLGSLSGAFCARHSTNG